MSHIDESLLQAYIDGACDGAETETVERHVEACEACRSRLQEAREAAARASELLGGLEPGPIHAPSFEELAARAAERRGAGTSDGVGDGGADGAADGTDSVAAAASRGVAESPASPATVVSPPFWRRPALAWAATLVIAFGLGWLSRSELGLPSGLQNLAAEQPQTAVRRDEPVSPQPAPRGLRSAAEPEETPAATAAAAEEAATELDDRAAPDLQAARPPNAPAESADVARRKTRDEEVAQAPPAAAGAERRVNQAAVAGEAGRIVEPERQQREAELNEQVGAATFYAFREGGYRPVSLDEVADWLGVAPRQLPDLTLVGAEVGPATLMPDGVPGLPAVRLVYEASSGQRIALVQQYLGALDAKEEAKLTATDRIAPAGAAERPQPRGAESRLRADIEAGADRDYFAIGGLADLPVTEVDPSGNNRRRWIDVDGYLLSLSGPVPADVLVGLADTIR